MARIGDVWDSTTDVLAGRAGVIAPIAAVALVLPSAVQGAVRAYGGNTAGVAAVAAVVMLGAMVVSLWGQLAVIAVASDPATTRADAGRQAARRLPAALLVLLVLVAIGILLLAPFAVALAVTGYDFQAASLARSAAAMPPMAPSAALFTTLYSLVLTALALWAGARLVVLYPVILNERRAIGAIGRSLHLTRGLTLKLIGVVLLFLVVWGVAALAVQSVALIVFRLLLGAANLPTAIFLAGIAGAAVTAAFAVIAQVFAARLHAALTGPRAA